MSVPWMPLYVADYLADTGHLNAAEHGAYMLLIMHYWRHGGLPPEESTLQRIARMSTAEWKRSRDTLAALFQEGWTHKRIKAELAKSEGKSARRAEAGSRGGFSKAEADKALKTLDVDLANATVLPQQTTKQTIANGLASSSQSQSHGNNQGSTEPNHSAPAEAGAARLSLKKAFETWYAKYPNKKGRLEAIRAFEKVSKQKLATFDELMLGLERYLKFHDRKIPWCHPSVWLNKGRWLDEYPGAPLLKAEGDQSDPRIDFGGGITAPLSTVRQRLEQDRWRSEWRGKPGEPGCVIPREFWSQILPKKAQAEQPPQGGLFH